MFIEVQKRQQPTYKKDVPTEGMDAIWNLIDREKWFIFYVNEKGGVSQLEKEEKPTDITFGRLIFIEKDLPQEINLRIKGSH